MRTLSRDDPRDNLLGLQLGLERAARLVRDGHLGPAELHATVEADLAAIGAVAIAGPDQKSRQALLDAVASHLLAAVDASMSGVRPEVVADLLHRAADRLRVAA